MKRSFTMGKMILSLNTNIIISRQIAMMKALRPRQRRWDGAAAVIPRKRRARRCRRGVGCCITDIAIIMFPARIGRGQGRAAAAGRKERRGGCEAAWLRRARACSDTCCCGQKRRERERERGEGRGWMDGSRFELRASKFGRRRKGGPDQKLLMAAFPPLSLLNGSSHIPPCINFARDISDPPGRAARPPARPPASGFWSGLPEFRRTDALCMPSSRLCER